MLFEFQRCWSWWPESATVFVLLPFRHIIQRAQTFRKMMTQNILIFCVYRKWSMFYVAWMKILHKMWKGKTKYNLMLYLILSIFCKIWKRYKDIPPFAIKQMLVLRKIHLRAKNIKHITTKNSLLFFLSKWFQLIFDKTRYLLNLKNNLNISFWVT